MLKVEFSVLMKLVKLLSRKADLGNGHRYVGEAVVERFCISKTDYISKLVPEIINVETVARKSLLAEIELALASCEMEALKGVAESARAYLVKCLAIVEDRDLYGDIERISAVK